MTKEMKLAKNKNLIILAVVVVLLVVGIVMTKNAKPSVKGITPAEAKTKVEAFIKDNQMVPADTKMTLGDPGDYNEGLYEMEVTIGEGQAPFKSYITKDGKLFIPQAMDMSPVTSPANTTDASATPPADAAPVTQAPKTDKPVVEVFVMSHCPFGTQIEKGIVPVAEALGKNIDFKIKFVDYAMHGEKEVKEQINQYCIDKEQSGSYLSYLKCFLKDGNTDRCLTETKIDTKKLTACFAATDKQFKIMETFAKGEAAWGSQFPPFAIYKAENDKYGVQGSPTLVINGKEISSGRDSASLAKAICGAFTDGKAPKECSNTFSSASPSSGFGEGTAPAASGGAAATCN